MTKPDTSAMITRGDRIDEGLLPCPHCGGSAELSPEIYSDENPSEVIGPAGVKCDDCGALVWGDWSADAIAAWNRRASHADAAPVAWMRKWAFDGIEVMRMPKKDRPVGWQLHEVTSRRCFPSDVPLYAAPATPPAAGSVTDEMVERALQHYLAKAAEYERDFRSETFSGKHWKEKYGTNLHSTALGEKWAMRAALAAAPVPPVVGEDAVERAAQQMALEYVNVDDRDEYSWDGADRLWRASWRRKAKAVLHAALASSVAKPCGVKDEELRRYTDRCKELSSGGDYAWWSRLAEILSCLSHPAQGWREPEGRKSKDGTPSNLSNRPGIYRLRNGNTAEVWGKNAREGNPLYPLYGSLPDSPEDDAWDTNGRNWAHPSYDLIERIGPLPTAPAGGSDE